LLGYHLTTSSNETGFDFIHNFSGMQIFTLNITPLDHHSWRQSDTAAVARNFALSALSFITHYL